MISTGDTQYDSYLYTFEFNLIRVILKSGMDVCDVNSKATLEDVPPPHRSSNSLSAQTKARQRQRLSHTICTQDLTSLNTASKQEKRHVTSLVNEKWCSDRTLLEVCHFESRTVTFHEIILWIYFLQKFS